MFLIFLQQQDSAIQDLLQDYARLKDISEAEDILAPAATWWWIVFVLLVMVIIFFYFMKKRKSVKVPEVLKTPKERALEALNSLREKGWIESQKIKKFVYEVNMITRQYLEDQFDLRAPEQTTDEFLSSKDLKKLLSDDQYNGLENFLGQCDLIKYADTLPSDEELNEFLSYSVSFVNALSPTTVVNS